MADVLDRARARVVPPDIVGQLIYEVERLRGELAKPRRDRAYRAGLRTALLDAAKMASKLADTLEDKKDYAAMDDVLALVQDLRRAAEGVKDA